jgi:hypothetical protein
MPLSGRATQSLKVRAKTADARRLYQIATRSNETNVPCRRALNAEEIHLPLIQVGAVGIEIASPKNKPCLVKGVAPPPGVCGH